MHSDHSLASAANVAVFALVFFDLFAIGLMIPPTYGFYAAYQFSVPLQGALTSAHALAQLLCSPLIGRALDRHGRKTIFVLSFTGTFVAYCLLGFASVPWLFVAGRIAIGMLRHSVLLARTYFSKSLNPAAKLMSFTHIATVSSFAFLLGPSIGSYLYQVNPQYPVYLTLALTLLNILISMKFVSNANEDERGDRPLSTVDATLQGSKMDSAGTILATGSTLSANHSSSWGILTAMAKEAMLLLLVRLLQMACIKLKRSTYANLMISTFAYQPKDVGYFTSYDGLIGTASGLVLSSFASHVPIFRTHQYTLSIISLAFVDVLMSLCSSSPYLFLSLTAFDVFFSTASNPLIQSAYSNCFKSDEQGSAMGLLGSVDNLGGILGPILGGLLLESGGLGGVYLFNAMVVACCIFLSSFFLSKQLNPGDASDKLK